MNKSDAKKYVSRFLRGLIEQQLGRGKTIPRDPFVYDYAFGEHAGKRMSCDDRVKVEEALYDVQWKLNQEVQIDLSSTAKVDGKPGAKWEGYRDQRKRQGYDIP